MNKIFWGILILATILRFFQLGVNPPSLDWDEASLGYNAYSILKTGADEYGNSLPLSIRSFDDYKPPVYVYLAVPAIALFGLNEFAVRLPAAVIGVLAVVLVYFLTQELFKNWKEREYIALTSMLFLAISPWHLQFSRAAFEGNVGLFFLMLGVFFFLKGLKKTWLFLCSAFAFILSLYSYHSFRLIDPFIILVLILMFPKELLKIRQWAITSLIIIILSAIPIYASFILPQGTGARLSMVGIFSDANLAESIANQVALDKSQNNTFAAILHNRRLVYAEAVAKGYLDHFNFDFLFLHGDGGVQHHAVDMGMLYLWDLPFILIGLYFIFRKLDERMLILLFIFFVAPLPASLTTGTPHPVRAIAMIPAFQIFSAVGSVMIAAWLLKQRSKIIGYSVVAVIAILLVGNFIYYLRQYYIFTPIKYGYFWQYGNKQAVQFAQAHENQYSDIVMTYQYDQPYIYYLFYNKIDPAWYQKHWDYNGNGMVDRFKRIIGKYQFRNINFSTDRELKNTLLIGTPDEIPATANILDTIYFPDGRVAYRIVKT